MSRIYASIQLADTGDRLGFFEAECTVQRLPHDSNAIDRLMPVVAAHNFTHPSMREGAKQGATNGLMRTDALHPYRLRPQPLLCDISLVCPTSRRAVACGASRSNLRYRQGHGGLVQFGQRLPSDLKTSHLSGQAFGSC
jgi:hypothetical protein